MWYFLEELLTRRKTEALGREYGIMTDSFSDCGEIGLGCLKRPEVGRHPSAVATIALEVNGGELFLSWFNPNGTKGNAH